MNKLALATAVSATCLTFFAGAQAAQNPNPSSNQKPSQNQKRLSPKQIKFSHGQSAQKPSQKQRKSNRQSQQKNANRNGGGAQNQNSNQNQNQQNQQQAKQNNANQNGNQNNQNNGSQKLIKLSHKPGQWVMPGKNYSITRYSKLHQINNHNVKHLQVAWTFSTGVLRGHEAAPLVVGDTMYIVTPWPNILYALDLKHQGKLKWKFNPHPSASAKGEACCDVVNRGAAYKNGTIFYNTLDDHVVAVNAKNGKLKWKTKVGSINKGATMTMAPLVVKNHVLVGVSGGELGVHGWIKALDTNSGKVQWTAYSTGSDKMVKIGKGFKAPYPSEKGKNLGESTWPSKSAWMHGGGPVWGWISYDPKANLIYYGTGNPSPWNNEQRPGDNKWTCTVFARDPDTGMAKWAYQYNPHDSFDYDGINGSILLNLKINGKKHKAMIHADRNGYMYLQDRLTGKLIYAKQYFPDENTILGVNMKTGRPKYNKKKVPKVGKTVSDICPASTGAKDWQPMAYSPKTGLVYIPHNHICQSEELAHVSYIAGTPFLGAKVHMKKGPGGYGGIYSAWNPVTGKMVWSKKEHFPVWSGTVVTAGNVAFYGTMNRWFKAVDAKTGKTLWKFRTGSGINGQPVTYRGPDGRQYVAVLAGVGGWSGAVVAGKLDANIPYGALGYVGATEDLPKDTSRGGELYVFALPKKKGGK
jgi:alcohol dehydrogenase (cytochrome c)